MRIPNLDSGNPITFSNSNGISFGSAGQTLTASVGTTARAAALVAGTLTATSGTVFFTNGNGVTFGMSGSSQITASATQSTGIGAVAVAGSTITNGTVVFSNSNNVSFGMSGSATVTATVNPPTLTYWNNLKGQVVPSLATTHHSLSIFPLNLVGPFPGLMTANTMLFNVAVTSTLGGAGSLLFSVGLYTLNGSTLSLLNSAASSITYSAAGNTTAFSGSRWLTLHSSQWSVQPVFSRGDYWLGFIWKSSNVTQGLVCQAFPWEGSSNAFRQGTVGVSNSNTISGALQRPFWGVLSASTSNLPTSIGSTDVSNHAAFASAVWNVAINNFNVSF